MMAESQHAERSFVGPPKKLIKRRYDREKRSRISTKKRNMFSWENVDGVRIPYIFRGDRKYVLVSVINEQLLARYPRWYPEEIRNCPPLLSVGITAEEADMLNQMEKRIFGDIGGPFLTGDLIVELDAALTFYVTLRDHYQKAGSAPTVKEAGLPAPPGGPPCSQQPATPVDVNDVSMTSADARTNARVYVPGYSVGYMHVIPDGWILVNNAVVPCIRRITAAGQSKLLPLPVVEEGIGKLDISTEILSSPVECFVLSAMCRAVGHQFTFPAGLKLVSLGTVLESKKDIFLHRLADQEPFQCASDIINRRIKDDELGDDLLSPRYGNKATSADLAFAEESQRPTYNQQSTVEVTPGGGVSPVQDLRTVINNSNNNHNNQNGSATSDEGFAEDCAGEILDLSMRGHRQLPEPGYDEVPKPTDLSEKSGSGGTEVADQVTGMGRESAKDAEVKDKPPVCKSDGYLNHSVLPAPLPIVENASCVNSLEETLTINESKISSHGTDLQSIVASTPTHTVVSSSNFVLAQSGDTQPLDVPSSSVQCSGLTVVHGNDLQSMNPPVVIPKSKKRKSAQPSADSNKRKIKRNHSKEKTELLLTSLSKQSDQLIQETRDALSRSGPCSLYAMALKKCKAVFGESFVEAGKHQLERNPLKGHLKKWLLTRSGKAKPGIRQVIKRAANEKLEPSLTKKTKLHKLVRKRSKLGDDQLKGAKTVVIHITKAPPSSSQSLADKNTPGEVVLDKPTSPPQPGVPETKVSRPTSTGRLPTLCELVDEINKPPVKYKRKCPFAGIDSLPKLPFLGLGGPHTLSSTEFRMHPKPSVSKGPLKKHKMRKGAKQATPEIRIQSSSTDVTDETMKQASVKRPSATEGAGRDSGILEKADEGSGETEPALSGLNGVKRPQKDVGDNNEITGCGESDASSSGSKVVQLTCGTKNGIPSDEHSGAARSQPSSSNDVPLAGKAESAAETKQHLDGNHLMETSSIIAQTNDLMEVRADNNDHCSTEAKLRPVNNSSQSDGRVLDGTAANPFGRDKNTSLPNKDCIVGKSQIIQKLVSKTPEVSTNTISAQCVVLSPVDNTVDPLSKDNHVISSGNLILRPVTEITKFQNMANHISNASSDKTRPVTNISKCSGGTNHIISSLNTAVRPVTDIAKCSSGGVSGLVSPLLRPVNGVGRLTSVSCGVQGAVVPVLRPVIKSGQPQVGVSHIGGLTNAMLKPVTDTAPLSGSTTHVSSSENTNTKPVCEIATPKSGAAHISCTASPLHGSVNNVTPSSVVINQVFDSVDKAMLQVSMAEIHSGNVNHVPGSALPVIGPVRATPVPLGVKDHIKVTAGGHSVPENELHKPALAAASINNSAPSVIRPVNALAMSLFGRRQLGRGMPLPVLMPAMTSDGGGRVTGKPAAVQGPGNDGTVLGNIGHAIGTCASGTIVRSGEQSTEITVIPFSPVSDVEEEEEEKASGIDDHTGTPIDTGYSSVSAASLPLDGAKPDNDSSSDTNQTPVSKTVSVSDDVNCVKGTASDTNLRSGLVGMKPVYDVQKCTNVERVNGAESNTDVNRPCQRNEGSEKANDPSIVCGQGELQREQVSHIVETRRGELAMEEQMDKCRSGTDVSSL